MYTAPDHISEPLYVITSIFNPIRYKSRWKHYERFAAHVKASGAILVTVECAFGQRAHALTGRAPTEATTFEVTRSDKPHIYVRVRTDQELWVKENLLNVGLTYLPPDAKYIAFVDADVQFARPNWVGETIHQLQHYQVVQMFSHAQDLGPHYAPVKQMESFAYSYTKDPASLPTGGYHYYYGRPKDGVYRWHPGFAWAWRRDALDSVGRLIDFAILGAADHHMAHALVGRVDLSIHPNLQPSYKEMCEEWQFQAVKNIRKNIGCVNGLLNHYWHGAKVDRKYWDRWRILVDNKFDPRLDIKYDWQGVLQLNDRGDERSIKLRDQLMQYFRVRNEDDIPTVDL